MDLTIPAAVASAAREFGNVTAVAEPGGPRLSYAELHERVAAVAGTLVAEGIAPGDRVALWSPNTHHWVLAALAALYAGATLVPVNTRFTGPEALDVVSRSGARALIVAGRFLGTDRLAALRAAAVEETVQTSHNVTSRAGPLDRVRLIAKIPIEADADRAGDAVLDWASLEAGVPGHADRARERAAAVTPEQVSDIMFTSGTTGRSKGAMSAHRQSLAVARAWAECGGLTSADRYLVVNPFFHTFGFKAGILACLVSGATLVPQAVFDAERAMALIEAEQITVFPGAPTIYQTILSHPARPARDLSSLRLAVTGAATVPVALVERMRTELGFDTVLTAYGLTEAVVATMCRPGDDPHTVAHTSGRATAGFEVRVAGTGGRPPDPGEILLRGPNVMLGYLDDPAATRAAIDADGWLHTGDIGRLDPRGYLTITDRLKDMYICGGFNVYPAEVEQVLARLDGVAESAVIGIPDARLGEVGKAYVVTRPGQVLSEAEVLAFCRARLANYKVPRVVEFRADLPRNPAGKPLKRLLRQESR
ncbi:MAG TPA: FadD3 family acyl-CoA ligase [Streptosporangiaceae bacterium]|nr:FadD3 family acyl-CoA ligase [Streptosporangiaceae bacterium]